MQNTYEIGGRVYPVTGWQAVDGAGIFPKVDIPLVSDYRWQLTCLESRLRHPEHYEGREDMAAVIGRIKAYLEENRETGEAEGLFQEYLAMTGGVIL